MRFRCSSAMARCIKKLGSLLQFSIRSQIQSCSRRANFSVSSAARSLTSFTGRTHLCGELRAGDAGKEVTLCGWLQYQRMDLFLLLRDWQGLTQLVLPEGKKAALMVQLSKVSFESVLEIHGTVRPRPAGQENKTMPTGSIEVVVESLKILNLCKPQLPFEIKPHQKANEAVRMQYRYLDIRRPSLQDNLRLRSTMVMRMREFLCNQHGFVDVETPTLFRRTPGGAKEFVVPSHHRGRFYSLPQSPQQFKQLLMVGGLDRYFQVARCYRDEGSKPDRQPEFTQVDIEMSFSTQEGVISLVEGLLEHSWPPSKGQVTGPFPRMTYDMALAKYGIDKPDTRFGMLIEDITKHLQDTSVLIFQGAESIQALTVKDGVKHLGKKDIENLEKVCKNEAENVSMLAIKVREGGSWSGGVSRYLSADDMSHVTSAVSAEPGDLILITAGQRYDTLSALGKARLKIAELLEGKGVSLRDKEAFNFLWVVDFPLFLPKEDGGDGLESAHHPFTAPHPEDEHMLLSDPLKVRSQHYDLVLNGNEIGGGSIRIHTSQLQRYILEAVLKEDARELEHLLEALDSGCPPHGGIALGLDRLLSLICGAESIRDVIAFPKSHDGKDPMSQAPAPVSQADLDPYHITITPEPLGSRQEGERESG